MVIPVGRPQHRRRRWPGWTSSTSPEVAGRHSPNTSHYVSPVEGVEEILEQRGPELAKNPLVFPTDEFTAQLHHPGTRRPDVERGRTRRWQDVRDRAEPDEALEAAPGPVLAAWDRACSGSSSSSSCPCTSWANWRCDSGSLSERLRIHLGLVELPRLRSPATTEQILRSFFYAGTATLLCAADRLPARLRDRLPRRPLQDCCCCSR